MVFAFRHQPLKGIYIAYELLSTLLVRVPWWILRSTLRSWRPRKSWSLARALRVHIRRHLSKVSHQVGSPSTVPNHLAIQPGPNVNGIWVDAVPELITGDLRAYAANASVSSIRIPGYWMYEQGSSLEIASAPTAAEKLVYFLHGGGYTLLSAHPSAPTATISRGLLDFADSVHRIFAVEYRLSSAEPFTVANPFPAALIDALAGYNYLVNVVGFATSNIIICGDSAGELPAPPGGLILLSPWCDLSDSHERLGSSMFNHQLSDFINIDEGYAYMKKAFLGSFGLEASETNRYISPACKYATLEVHFRGFPRTFIAAGGAEVLLDQIRTLHQRMANDMGVGNGVKHGEGKVRYFEAPDSIHDHLCFDWHEPERSNALKAIAGWIAAT
ncbi:hypothetical protein APHAL10511_004867 [Amanita phalloides]|nr:hypothetical protein APHAL10511_004867 [Amanita phalloides]